MPPPETENSTATRNISSREEYPDGADIDDISKGTAMSRTLVARFLIILSLTGRPYLRTTEKIRFSKQVFKEWVVQDCHIEIMHGTGRKTPDIGRWGVYRNETGLIQGLFPPAREVVAIIGKGTSNDPATFSRENPRKPPPGKKKRDK